MRLFNKKNKDYFGDVVFNKVDVIKEILEDRKENCPGWKLLLISKDDDDIAKQFDSLDCDFLAIYTDLINKEIRLNSNPYSDYKRTVESVYQIVREIYINDEIIEDDSEQIYKRITAKSSKELFIKLKNEVI